MNLQIVNLKEVIENGLLEVYSEKIKSFKSLNNDDVELFITQKAELSCKMKQSVTYLVYDKEKDDIVAYFTLIFKILDIPLAWLSKSLQKDLEKNGRRSDDSIQIPGVLLAQWSKNFALKELISGKNIMEYVEMYFHKIQNLAGGNFIFLECEKDKEHLLQAYDKVYGYKIVSERLSNEGKPLFQLIKKL